MQYLPAGGGGIGPTDPGTVGARTAYPLGAYIQGIGAGIGEEGAVGVAAVDPAPGPVGGEEGAGGERGALADGPFS
jgi:hypothetical protein